MPPRSRIEIYAEMLDCCRNGATTSIIIHGCNLKYPLFKESIGFLKSKGLIREMTEEGKTTFMNTEKGNEALMNYAKYYLQLFQRPLEPFTRRHMKNNQNSKDV